MKPRSRQPRLFIGHLGVDKCFFVQARGLDTLHLPTDLLGLTALTFNPERSDGNVVAALGTACNQIRRAMREAARKDMDEAIPHAPVPEASDQKFERLVSLWNGDAFKADSSILHTNRQTSSGRTEVPPHEGPG